MNILTPFMNTVVKRFLMVLALTLPVGVLFILFLRSLLYSDAPQRADIIVLFLGGEHELRPREARQLLQEGYCNYLFVPDSFSFYRAVPGKNAITPVRLADVGPGIGLPGPLSEHETTVAYFRKNRAAYRFPGFYESTHVETLLAKRAMDACGFKKALLVSSPYHMRRIKLMAGSVFDSSYDIKLIPTRFEKWNGDIPASWRDLRHSIMEFPKIIWFLCYEQASRWGERERLCGNAEERLPPFSGASEVRPTHTMTCLPQRARCGAQG